MHTPSYDNRDNLQIGTQKDNQQNIVRASPTGHKNSQYTIEHNGETWSLHTYCKTFGLNYQEELVKAKIEKLIAEL